jgi:oxygen-independent coproporphyrinogen III oxidase
MSKNTQSDAGIYIHIPYCRRKCDYCSFYSINAGEPSGKERPAIPDAFISAVVHEIGQRSAELKPFECDTVYFGGGTPSLLRPDQVESVLAAIKKRISTLNDGIEITLECNPEDFGTEKITAYHEAGINRIVLGVQTMNPVLHDFIGRNGAICSHSMLVEFMKVPGLTHCIDLITGIPGQTLHDIREDLAVAAELRPEHISAYMLSLEKGTSLYDRYAPEETFPSLQREIFSEVMRVLIDAGYEHYEVSNFALPGFRSRHNMKYWTFRQYAGFGPGAHSFIGGRRFANAQNVEDYIALKCAVEYDERNENADTVEYVLTGMRLAGGISEKRFRNDTGRPFPGGLHRKFAEMKSKGQVDVSVDGDDVNYSFTREGFFIMDMLLADLLDEFIQ